MAAQAGEGACTTTGTHRSTPCPSTCEIGARPDEPDGWSAFAAAIERRRSRGSCAMDGPRWREGPPVGGRRNHRDTRCRSDTRNLRCIRTAPMGSVGGDVHAHHRGSPFAPVPSYSPPSGPCGVRRRLRRPRSLCGGRRLGRLGRARRPPPEGGVASHRGLRPLRGGPQGCLRRHLLPPLRALGHHPGAGEAPRVGRHDGAQRGAHAAAGPPPSRAHRSPRRAPAADRPRAGGSPPRGRAPRGALRRPGPPLEPMPPAAAPAHHGPAAVVRRGG